MKSVAWIAWVLIASSADVAAVLADESYDEEAVKREQIRQIKGQAFEDYRHDVMAIPVEIRNSEPIDTKTVLREWKQNQARAQLKYDQPHLYSGVLGRVQAVNGTVYFIVDPGTPNEVAVVLARLQGIWKRLDGKLMLEGVDNQMEYAARFDPGDRFTWYCPKATPLFGKMHLLECIAFEGTVFD